MDPLPLFLRINNKEEYGRLSDLAWHPFYDSEALLASANNDSRIMLWRVTEKMKIHEISDTKSSNTISTSDLTLSGHERGVTSVLFHPKVVYLLASAGAEGFIRLWDIVHGKDITSCHHEDMIHSFIWSFSGDIIVSTSRDKWIRMFDPKVPGQIQCVS
jgi:coronin-1B/1C/6